MEGFRDVRVSRVFPVEDMIGIDYEVTVASSSLMVNGLNEIFAVETGLEGFLGSSVLVLRNPTGKRYYSYITLVNE